VGAAKLHADRRTGMSEAMRGIRPALFWDITQPLEVIFCRRFGTTLSVLSSRVKNKKNEVGTDRLSRNVSKELPLPLRNSPEKRCSHDCS